jgi:hypothetical protein
MGTAQPAAFLQQFGQTSIVLVGSGDSALTGEQHFLPGVKTQPLTADEVIANPDLVLERAREASAQTVLVVGDFNAVEPALKTIAASITPTMTLLYTPGR